MTTTTRDGAVQRAKEILLACVPKTAHGHDCQERGGDGRGRE